MLAYNVFQYFSPLLKHFILMVADVLLFLFKSVRISVLLIFTIYVYVYMSLCSVRFKNKTELFQSMK